ncbi:MAG: hypothetical protein C4331_16735 [Meiothermus sp.]
MNPRGSRPILNQEEQQAPWGPAPDGGLWTAPKVTAWVYERWDKNLWGTTPLRYLHRLGFRLKRPRPRHRQAAFKKHPGPGQAAPRSASR